MVSYNRNVLRMQGIGSSNYMDTLYSMVAILVLLIAVGSISLIYNAFAISVSERSRQFGMLSGVGATSRQIRHAVFFEAFTVGGDRDPAGGWARVSAVSASPCIA